VLQDAAGFGATPSLAAGIEKPFPSHLEARWPSARREPISRMFSSVIASPV
jgi:hypothetical protein